MNSSSKQTGQYLELLVAGHTNTGKTSMLRTLGRLHEFGDVSARSSTTRSINKLRLVDTENFIIDVFDSPGFECAPELRDKVDNFIHNRRDRVLALTEIITDSDVQTTFAFEVMILNKAFECDALIYIIDAREPILEKYLDEIYLLSLCGKPLICLLNFTAEENREAEWRKQLNDIGQHLVVAFDAVVYNWDSEKTLYGALEHVLPESKDAINWLSKERQRDNDWRLKGASYALAEMLIELAASEDIVSKENQSTVEKTTQSLQHFASEREKKCTRQILSSFNYSPTLHGQNLHADFDSEGWQRDPFASDTFRRYGIEIVATGTGGAGLGLTIDLMTGGATLGIGTLTGLLSGGLIGARRILRNVYLDKIKNSAIIALNNEVLLLIATRNIELITNLNQQGHGSVHDYQIKATSEMVFNNELPKPLLKARDKPSWSTYRNNPNYVQIFKEQPKLSFKWLIFQKIRQSILESLQDSTDEKEAEVIVMQRLILMQVQNR